MNLNYSVTRAAEAGYSGPPVHSDEVLGDLCGEVCKLDSSKPRNIGKGPVCKFGYIWAAKRRFIQHYDSKDSRCNIYICDKFEFSMTVTLAHPKRTKNGFQFALHLRTCLLCLLTTALGGCWALEQPELSAVEFFPPFLTLLASLFESYGETAAARSYQFYIFMKRISLTV